MAKTKPLVLDVDGSFLRTDMLFECFWAGMGRDPIATLRVIKDTFGDKAALKAGLADLARPRVDLMPVSAPVEAVVAAAKSQKVEVVLASASDISLVTELAQVHDLSPTVFASENGVNLRGAAKADALVEAYGEGGFHYAGNEPGDMAIWERADEAIIVGTVAGAKLALIAEHGVTELPGGWAWRDLIRALRPHQYVKNVLLLLPLIAAHQFGLVPFLTILLAIVAFSAAASCIYVVNDLLDLEADRLHVKKKHRPFASGAVPINVGMITCLALGVIALGVAAFLNWAFFGIVALYMLLSLAYSLKLKRLRWVDIATLAALYTIRVVAGAAAAEINVTGYMLAFIFPVFVTLGCVKRLTELTLATSDERLPGRGYGKPDRPDLMNVACLGMFAALLVFFLYSYTDHALSLYKSQWLLWVAMLPIGGWLWRMVSLGYKGKQDHDPIVFAMKDRHGLSLLIFAITIMFYAAGLFHDAFGF
ncbi:UbiA family prenyltransferase [uncultured Litoreibacter sp.]|uniref:UbiA family prenyltransferase n=1 Tax=uncultured Litoreibacter sp. TaxID=1392394 RepID=UPI00263A39B4|nr:UbiA family prenyltransferase [uncultured Litoreibacter sp.]